MITESQYKIASKQKEDAERIMELYHKERVTNFTARLASGKPFTDDELVYAAHARCVCGHGLAYPKDCGINHYWDCSAILRGVADTGVTHSGRYPFAFYEIKSEKQPSAGGATTRGTVITGKK